MQDRGGYSSRLKTEASTSHGRVRLEAQFIQEFETALRIRTGGFTVQEDKGLLAQYLWGHDGRIRLPLFEPLPLVPCPEFPSMGPIREVELDFRTETVKVPAISLHFNDIRKIWEAIVLYSEIT